MRDKKLEYYTKEELIKRVRQIEKDNKMKALKNKIKGNKASISVLSAIYGFFMLCDFNNLDLTDKKAIKNFIISNIFNLFIVALFDIDNIISIKGAKKEIKDLNELVESEINNTTIKYADDEEDYVTMIETTKIPKEENEALLDYWLYKRNEVKENYSDSESEKEKNETYYKKGTKKED